MQNEKEKGKKRKKEEKMKIEEDEKNIERLAGPFLRWCATREWWSEEAMPETAVSSHWEHQQI